MLNITFKIDKNIIARFVISKNIMKREYANYLWSKYQFSYMKLQHKVLDNTIDNNIILELQQQDFFNDYLKDAEENLKRIENYWQANKDKINTYLEKIFKKNFDLTTTAIIVPCYFNSGMNIGSNEFIWGHNKGLKNANYDLIYIVHESLHSYFKDNMITHAIIENIADIELSKFLKSTDIANDAHDYLKDTHIKVLPFWNIYLNKSKETIEKENEENNISYNFNEFKTYEKEISKMNIDDFVNFLESLNLNQTINYTNKIIIKTNNK